MIDYVESFYVYVYVRKYIHIYTYFNEASVHLGC